MTPEKKKITLIALAVAAACLVGVLAFRFLQAPRASDLEQGDAENVTPDNITVSEPAMSETINLGQYHNGEVRSLTLASGATLSAGLASGGDEDHIYLNLNYSEARPEGDSVGYYIKSERGLMEYSDWDEILTDCDSEDNAGHANFYIPRQIFDRVATMEYVDSQRYGVRWSDDGSDGTIGGTIINVRAINLNTAEFIGVFDINISYDEDAGYMIQSVTSADVRETGLLTDEERADAVNKAIAFAEGTVLTEDMYHVADWQNTARVGAFVHKSSRSYFGRLLNTEKKSDKFANHYTCQDTFAVTLPVSLYGYLTVYLAPQTECIGLTEPTLYDSDDLDLQVYGYDPLNPRTEETIIVPTDFFSY